MRRKRIVWMIMLALAALGAGGYAYATYGFTPAQAQATDAPIQTAQARRGELVISASGVGTVIPAAEIAVGFASSGLIESIYVQVGDEVEAGDVLAQQGDLDQLKLAKVTAEANLTSAQKVLQALYDNWELDRANAQMAVYQAQASLDDAVDARTRLNYSRCDQDLIADYYDAYLKAVEMIGNLNRDSITGDRLSNAEASRDTALANYNYCTAPRTTVEIGEADASAALAQATLAQAEVKLAKIQDGPDADEIAQAEISVRVAEIELSLASENLDKATLKAPIAGTVMTINAQEGETTGAAFITIADLRVPMLEIFLDETDMAMAGVGYEVNVTFDALADQTFVGRILSVDPSLASSGMTKVIRAVVSLDEKTFTRAQTLPVGLSASVDVIGSRAENAVLVPVEALRDLGDGQYAVFVMENGTPKLRLVEVGIMDYTYVQILSGLEEGETVTTGIVETE